MAEIIKHGFDAQLFIRALLFYPKEKCFVIFHCLFKTRELLFYFFNALIILHVFSFTTLVLKNILFIFIKSQFIHF